MHLITIRVRCRLKLDEAYLKTFTQLYNICNSFIVDKLT